MEYLKKSESDSAFHRVLHQDLEGAKDVQEAFFPSESLAIPGLSSETFYRPAHGIGGYCYDFLGKTPGGRFCNVFRFRDGRISSLHIYLDPDYTGEDEARFRWGKNRQW